MQVKARAADLSTRTTKTKEKMKREATKKSPRTWKMKMRRETKKKNPRTWTTKMKRETKKKNLRTWTMKMKMKRETKTRSPRTTQKLKRKAKITGLAARMEMARTTKRRR